VVPRKACPTCQETGRRWFEEARGSHFDLVYLQDRVSRVNLVKRS
jgi:hypothetical protein